MTAACLGFGGGLAAFQPDVFHLLVEDCSFHWNPYLHFKAAASSPSSSSRASLLELPVVSRPGSMGLGWGLLLFQFGKGGVVFKTYEQVLATMATVLSEKQLC